MYLTLLENIISIEICQIVELFVYIFNPHSPQILFSLVSERKSGYRLIRTHESLDKDIFERTIILTWKQYFSILLHTVWHAWDTR